MIKKWESLPLPIDFSLIVYGGYYKDTNYDIGNLSKNIPKNIKNGFYYVEDRYAKKYPKEKDININSGYSYNVTISIFDLNTNKLYIYILDT
ncbi:hypothetical protein FDG30_15900 [Clostridium sporogenes]|uniref:hypothetical protein n=1 Tax=Clostridium sporogenes TaxID=1509 RepID=UPI0013D78EB7|nr:hypothetical protein [Clostridium sporogenes]NFU40939.1 hypothetical protein [Clostridium sporogenes]